MKEGMTSSAAKPDRQEFNPQALAEAIAERERERQQIDVRIKFAERVALLKKEPLANVVYKYTDLYRRLGLGLPPREEPEDERQWGAYIRDLRMTTDPLWVTVQHWSSRDKQKQPESFGPFSYDYFDDKKVVSIHFGTIPEGATTALSANVAAMQKHLADLLIDVRDKHPKAEVVTGRSWLYTRLLESERFVELLKQVFPESFLASTETASAGYQGGARWGQFLDAKGGVNVARKQEFLEKLKHVTLETLDDAFPYAATTVSAPIGDFYKKYGIKSPEA